MQTHLSLYQHNLERLAQLHQEAAANALARRISKNQVGTFSSPNCSAKFAPFALPAWFDWSLPKDFMGFRL